MVNRKNSQYPPWYRFTVRKCKKCGEMYEPFCELQHICKKQNSYPTKKNKEGDQNE